MTDVRTLYLTAADEEQAVAIAEALLARGLIACANVLPPMRSLYRWRGRTHDEGEVAMLLKTRADRVDEAIEAACEVHPYEEPCVVAWPIVAGAAPYLAWVRDACAP